MSGLSFPHMHQIDLYNFDRSFFSIVISSTTFGSVCINLLRDGSCSGLHNFSPPLLLTCRVLIPFCLLSDTLLVDISSFPLFLFPSQTSGLCVCNHGIANDKIRFSQITHLKHSAVLCPWYDNMRVTFLSDASSCD